METTKIWLSLEISEDKKKKKFFLQAFIILETLLVLTWYTIPHLIFLATNVQPCLFLPIYVVEEVQLPVLLSLCMLEMGLFVLYFFIPLGKISEPTDEEIKALAQKKLNDMEKNGGMSGHIRENLKKIINEEKNIDEKE